jgi:glycosyltransferase involved in cell wall biosynthesis
MPRVSVIIPTHDRAELLPRAVESAFAAGKDVEVVVVDDASTDETPVVCRRWPGVRYVRLEQNQGVAAARNIGIDVSSSEYVAFLDDDDERLPGSLDRQADALDAEPAASLAYGQVQFASARDGRLTGEISPRKCLRGDVFWDLMRYNFIYVPSTLARRERVTAVGAFVADCLEDWHLWLRLAERAPIVAVEGPVAVYRVAALGSKQYTSNTARLSAMSDIVREKARRFARVVAAPTEEPAALARLERDLRSDRLIWDAAYALDDGKRATRSGTCSRRCGRTRCGRVVLGRSGCCCRAWYDRRWADNPMASRKVLLLAPYPLRSTPSQRFRFEQYLAPLAADGFDIDVRSFLAPETMRIFHKSGHLTAKVAAVLAGAARRLRDIVLAKRYDVVFVHREAFPLGYPILERLLAALGRPYLFDFDDAIFLTHTTSANRFIAPFKFARKTAEIVRHAGLVIAGNNYLADWARQHQSRVTIIPTTIDTDLYRPRTSHANGRLCVGWSGSVTTIAYLRTIEDVLRDLQREFNVRLRVIGDASYRLAGAEVESLPWREQTEVADIGEIDIGVMPVPDEEWARENAV